MYSSPIFRQRISALTDAQIAYHAPAVFADAAHGSRSERYGYVPTVNVLAALREAGFVVTRAQQSRTRIADRAGHTKHLLTLVRADMQPAKVGDSVPTVTLLNSHDGSSAYRLIAGIYRLVCDNGMMVADSLCQSIHVGHTKNAVRNVIDASYTVIEGANRAGEVAADWRSIALSAPEQNAFADAALALRWDGEEHKAPIAGSRLLTVRREDDRPSNLWTVFNRVQENLTQGGLRGRSASGRRQATRAVTGIDGNVALNRALWTLGERMAEIKRPVQAAA